MSSKSVQPSTLDGIKRLARSIKAEQGIQHARALDEAARAAGFHNFKHSRNVLRTHSELQHPRHQVFVSAYWRNKETEASGRETLAIWLSSPWGDLVRPAQLDYCRGLSWFGSEGPDHLRGKRSHRTQPEARRSACAAARTLQFMDATKLRPSKGHARAYPQGRYSNAIPGLDHDSTWYDPVNKRYLLVDEPYEASVLNRADERKAWAVEHGLHIAKPTWPGMYYPDGGCRLYLISDIEKGITLDPIVQALNRLPAPIVEETWNGESAPVVPWFISPGAMAKGNAAKDAPTKSRGTAGKRMTVGYFQTFVGRRRRPKTPMPLDAHRRVSVLLNSVLAPARNRNGVFNPLNQVRTELDEWIQREYDYQQLPNEEFSSLYYPRNSGNPERILSQLARTRHIENLEQVKSILAQHYPDSPPLRDLLRKIDRAMRSLSKWCDGHR
jgi:hypothetical protein